jgi:flavocytochrome c
MEKLEEIAEADPDRVQMVRKARVTSLIYEDGEVKGVEYEFKGEKHREHGPVILATGGYAADFHDVNSLLKKHRPDLMHLSTTNGDWSVGEGHKMTAAIGGNLIDMEKVQVHPTGLVDPKEPDAKVKFLAAEALRGCGGLLLDNEGKRFVDELQKRDWVSNAMFKHDKFPVRLVLNGKASQEIEWHCKHYTSRGLMKRFEHGRDLAKEIGCDENTLKETFEKYTKIASGDEKDPFGKKYFSNGPFVMDDYFYVAQMQPVLHYTMGGLEINDKAEVLDTNQKVIPGLFACGEIAGGVHGANRLGGSSLLGCVVFGRVAGDTSSAYLLRNVSSGKIATGRAGQVAQHLQTTVSVHPESKNVQLTFSWAGGAEGQQAVSGQPSAAESAPPTQTSTAGPTSHQATSQNNKKDIEQKQEERQISMEEVAKHDKEGDAWVVVEDMVLKVDDFLPDHPGGPKAILMFAGKDATEGFLQFHETSVIKKYASDTVIGKLKQ